MNKKMKTLKLSFNPIFPFTKSDAKNNKITYFFLIGFLIILIALGTLPGYLQGGKWAWADLAQIENVNKLNEIKEKGLKIPGWQTQKTGEVQINDKKWLVQLISKDNQEVTLLLLPQKYYLNHPAVEWTDINKMIGWKSDNYRKLKFNYGEKQHEVEALFLRSWNAQQTFAVIQWYAWESGGSFTPKNWFWYDLLAQLQKRRATWVAVCLRIPIQPLGDIETVRDTAVSMAREIQVTLHQNLWAQVK